MSPLKHKVRPQILNGFQLSSESSVSSPHSNPGTIKLQREAQRCRLDSWVTAKCPQAESQRKISAWKRSEEIWAPAVSLRDARQALGAGVRAIHLQRYPSILFRLAASPNTGAQSLLEENRTFLWWMVFDCSPSQHVRVFSFSWEPKKGQSSARLMPQEPGAPQPSERGAVGQLWNLCATTGKRCQRYAPKHEIKPLLLRLFHCILARSQWQGLGALAGFILWPLVLQNSVTSN